ncbi:hypothetical protein [Streptomyces hirsutus]
MSDIWTVGADVLTVFARVGHFWRAVINDDQPPTRKTPAEEP